jgi:hypothetical protein
MKKIFLLPIIFIFLLTACGRKPAKRHQELVEDHELMEREHIALEDRYATLLQDYHDFAALHRQMLEGKIDTNVVEMEARHQDVLQRHAELLLEHQQLVQEHARLEEEHEGAELTEERIAQEHERIKMEHENMKAQHEQILEELEQLRVEWRDRITQP